MNNFRELKVWQKARVHTKNSYAILKKFPQEELYGLTSQIKRATISITSNIAEGSGRNTDADFSRFLDIALGSCFEVDSQYILALDLGFVNEADYQEINSEITEIERMLIGLINSIRK